MEKALQEDPSVFEYDAVYDEMENKKRESDPRLKSQEEKKVSIDRLYMLQKCLYVWQEWLYWWQEWLY